MTTNQIEELVPFLAEVGGSLLAAAARIDRRCEELKHLEDEVEQARREITQAREHLLARALTSYAAPEIGTADVLCTRSK